MSRHDRDAVSLMLGLVLALAAGMFLLADLTELDLELRWAAPVALLAIGAAGLAATARRVGSSPESGGTAP